MCLLKGILIRRLHVALTLSNDKQLISEYFREKCLTIANRFKKYSQKKHYAEYFVGLNHWLL